jgi:hypothetical protein
MQQNPIKIIKNEITGFMINFSIKFIEISRTIAKVINVIVIKFVNVEEVTKNDQYDSNIP